MPAVSCRSCGRDFMAGDPPAPQVCPACRNLPTLAGVAPPEAPPIDAPAAVPGYQILSEIGRGGMGVVYKAKQTALNRIVALKVILVGAHASAHERSRFRTEAETVARLHHPNIVQIYELGESPVPGGTVTLPYLSLEYCGGGSLDRRLRSGPLPPHLAAGLIETLARAVQHAHEAKVIHRDLKPGNVLFDEKGVPKLADFGLAKKLDEQGHTRTGTVMGTPAYASPEQVSGNVHEVGPATDLYALGAILHECLTGRPPFRGKTVMDTIVSVVNDPVPAMPPTVPPPLTAICQRCLQKRPQDRYPTAQALAADLRRFLAGQRVAAFVALPAPAVAGRPSLAGWLLGVLALAVLSLVAYGAYRLMRGPAQEGPRPQETVEPGFRLPDDPGEARWQKVTQKEGKVTAVAWDHNGKRIATVDDEGRVGIWLLETNQFLRQGLDDKMTPLTSVVISRAEEGREVLLLGDATGHASLWPIFEGKAARRWSDSRPSALKRALFREGEREVLACHEDGIVIRRSVETGKVLGMLRPAAWLRPHLDQPQRLLDAAVRPGSDQLLVALRSDAGADLVLIDVGGGRVVRSYPPTSEARGAGHRPTCCAFTADGAFVVSGDESGEVYLWKTDTGELVYTFDRHRKGPVTAIATTRKGRRAVSAASDGRIRLYDLDRHAEDEVYDAGERPVCGLSFAPDGRHFVSGGGDGLARIWPVPPPMKR